jgi:hypothetical protein
MTIELMNTALGFAFFGIWLLIGQIAVWRR